MITSSFGLTATERILPVLALDFTTASLDPRITFTRANDTATVINASGAIVASNANTPRFDYNPSTLTCNGLLIEESRTNALLNSLLDGSNLLSQVVTVTASARTLSFYGTGSIVLSGAHSATITGAGAYPARTVLTFTPTAGALTLTVTGTVQFAQLEAGAFATSFIPTLLEAVTRSADSAVMTGTNFTDWFNASEGGIVAEWIPNQIGAAARPVSIGSSNTNVFALVQAANGVPQFQVIDNGSLQASLTTGGLAVVGTSIKLSGAYKVNNFAKATQGANLQTDNAGTIPANLTTVVIGAFITGAQPLNGCVSKIIYYKQRPINAEVQAFSK